MPRLKGQKNPPGAKKPGPKPRISVDLKEYLDALTKSGKTVLANKIKIIELLTEGKAINVTAAAREIGINPVAVRYYLENDPDFKECVGFAKTVVAEGLEDELSKYKQSPIPKMMILKGLKPEYKDKYQGERSSSKLEQLLERLISLREQPPKELPKPKDYIEGVFVEKCQDSEAKME